MRKRLMLKQVGELIDRDGTVVGSIESITVNIDMAFLGAMGVGAEREKTKGLEKTPLAPGDQPQQTMLTDPVLEVWEHYQQALDRPRAQLTPKVRRWISDALEAVGTDRVKAAINGLAASDHHRQNGYVGIEYAIKPKVRETIDGRISMMEAKAPQSSNAGTTVDALLAKLPSETRSIVRRWMNDVQDMMRNPNHAGLKATGEARLRDLRDRAKIEPVIVDDRIESWQAVSS